MFYWWKQVTKLDQIQREKKEKISSISPLDVRSNCKSVRKEGITTIYEDYLPYLENVQVEVIACIGLVVLLCDTFGLLSLLKGDDITSNCFTLPQSCSKVGNRSGQSGFPWKETFLTSPNPISSYISLPRFGLHTNPQTRMGSFPMIPLNPYPKQN